MTREILGWVELAGYTHDVHKVACHELCDAQIIGTEQMAQVLNEIKVRHEEAVEQLEICDDDEEKLDLEAKIKQYKKAPISMNDLTGKVAFVMK